MSDRIDLNAILAAIGTAVAAGAAERDEADRFAAENYEMLKAHRVFSALVPSELGGGGASHREMCAFLRALARHCSATALALSMHQHLVAAALFNHRAGRPGGALLAKVADGEKVCVSTGANDWLGSNGRVERVEGGYRITATKPFASGSPAGDILLTSAPYEDPREGWQVLHFPVPLAAEGVARRHDWRALGMRATGSESVVLDRVFVPDAAIALRRPRHAYHPAWNVILGAALPLIMSVYAGVAQGAAAIAREQARARLDDPTIPVLLGELANHLTIAEIAVDSMVALADDLRFAPTTETADAMLVRKTIAAEAVIATAEKALEIAGGAGFYRTLGLERLVRDAHGARLHPLPSRRQQHFTGRCALGLDPIGAAAMPAARAAAE